MLTDSRAMRTNALRQGLFPLTAGGVAHDPMIRASIDAASLRERMPEIGDDRHGGFFPADERLVGPGVIPIAVASAIADAHILEEAVDRLERRGAVVIVDHVGVAVHGRVLEQDRIVVANEPAAPEIADH